MDTLRVIKSKPLYFIGWFFYTQKKKGRINVRVSSAVSINIGGEDRDLRFTHNALVKLERILPKQNIYSTVTEAALPYSVEIPALMIALEAGGTKGLKIDVVEKWRDKYIDENGAFALNAKLIEAIYMSGIMGNPSKFKELIHGEVVDAEVVEEKN